MRLLVLGGTAFVGRAVVADALARGHEVTLFGRGRTGADLFPGVARRTGDRAAGDYGSLAGGTWDAVVDVSAYVPRHVAQAADALADSVDRYLFVSTVSVYDPASASPGFTEDSPRVAAVRDTEDVTGDSYGGLKVACEDDLRDAFGDRLAIVRPGIVAGPHDHTERFTLWARRAARGGLVALPGRPDQAVQVVDSRDLARLVVLLLESGSAATVHAVGPAEPVTLAGLVLACAVGAGTSVEVAPVDPGRVAPPLPLVLPDAEGDVLFQASPAAAAAAGMPATPLAGTAADTLAWDRERGTPPLPAELSPQREAELLSGGG